LKNLKDSRASGKREITMTRHKKFGMLVGVVLGMFVSASVFAAPDQAAVCAGCHAEDGNSTQAMFPKLAGQTNEYIAKQLSNFITGKRKNELMAPIAAELKPADIAVLSNYFSSQKTSAGTVQDAKLAAVGKKIFLEGVEASDVPVCAGCHMSEAQGSGIYPKLAGQHADYIYLQLKNFSTAERNNDVSRFMRVTAKHMNDEQMKAVAEYLSGL
jgi:cytochrome c553